MKHTSAFNALKALGQSHRLHVFRVLVRAGKQGLSVGAIAAATGLPGATLNNHLNILRNAGLIDDERRGRSIICHANYALMNALLGYLTENCCADDPAGGACKEAVTTCDTTSASRKTRA
ncbi:MAG: metalloregulator ArsR/SmtB family transcription factor [Rhodanobacteraceae bacterium]